MGKGGAMTNKDASGILKTEAIGHVIPDVREALLMGAYELEQEPCGDCISRNAVLALPRSKVKDLKTMEVVCETINVKDIESLPPVTPKQRTGHWIETAEEYYKAVNEYGGGVNEDTPYFVDDIACSVCLAMFSTIDNETERFNYCPHCGAKMVEPQERSE